ncbi:MAG TPA: glutamate--tRNA ligase [Gammaproteobacteria bacterium]|nr:glutamate--tRNA ligase [Gammaproteobacteria bacterium]
MSVKTRFAPSPTGYLHIGGARTALFSWLHARRQQGRFVLRIEDTDRERSTQESVDVILEAMEWLELDYDEGPYYQTRRFDRYREVVERLLREGKAYPCYCSRERLEALREEQLANREKPRYDGHCRDRQGEPPAGVTPVIRFRNPQRGEVVVGDLVRGRVTFSNAELDDLIIQRSDGTPTYNFTVVVDDADMGITHVIRGDDHLNNTPRQINIFRALGLEPPSYGHVPMILGEDGKRLSKRHGAVSVLQYRDQGYLPQALLNYLVRLGWSYGDKEVFTVEEMVDLFEITSVNRAASVFNPEKLSWLNQQHLKSDDPAAVAEHLRPHMRHCGYDLSAGPSLVAVVEAFRERARTLVDMAESARPFFEEVQGYDEKAAKKHFKDPAPEVLARLRERLAAAPAWERDVLHREVLVVTDEMELKLGKVAQPLRVALTGTPVSPPIDMTLELLGRERSLQRIDRALAWIRGEQPVA